MLSRRSQIVQMRRLAREALGAYPLAFPELRFIAHGENTTFRVDARVSGGRERFLLRVHRRSSATRWSTAASTQLMSGICCPAIGGASSTGWQPAWIAFGLWFTGTAQANPAFRAELGEVQQDISHSLSELTGV